MPSGYLVIHKYGKHYSKTKYTVITFFHDLKVRVIKLNLGECYKLVAGRKLEFTSQIFQFLYVEAKTKPLS